MEFRREEDELIVSARPVDAVDRPPRAVLRRDRGADGDVGERDPHGLAGVRNGQLHARPVRLAQDLAAGRVHPRRLAPIDPRRPEISPVDRGQGAVARRERARRLGAGDLVHGQGGIEPDEAGIEDEDVDGPAVGLPAFREVAAEDLDMLDARGDGFGPARFGSLRRGRDEGGEEQDRGGEGPGKPDSGADHGPKLSASRRAVKLTWMRGADYPLPLSRYSRNRRCRMNSLQDKIVFVTGATSGIGRSCVRAFAREGARVLFCGRRADRLDQLAGEVSAEFGVPVHFFTLDVRDLAAVIAAIAALPAEWAAVDVLVNNAGLSRGLDKLHEGKISDWEEMIDTNVKGLLYVSRAVIPGMVARGRGHIINIGSIAGHELYPGGNVYCATKFAVNALSRGLRLDLNGTPLRVSTVDPGMVETEFSLVRFHGDERAGGEGLQGPPGPDARRHRRSRRLLRDPAGPRQHQRDDHHAHGPGFADHGPPDLIGNRALEIAVGLAVEAVEVGDHEVVAPRGEALPFRREHPVLDVAELDHELPVGRVLLRVRGGLGQVDPLVVEAGPHLAGEEEGPADPDGADRIELVGVEEDAGLEGAGREVLAEAVGLDAVDDPLDPPGVEAEAGEDLPGQPGARIRVPDLAVRAVLLAPADVVEQGGQGQDLEVGFFGPADMQAEAQDAGGVVPVVAAAGGAEEAARFGADRGDELAVRRGGGRRRAWRSRSIEETSRAVYKMSPRLKLTSRVDVRIQFRQIGPSYPTWSSVMSRPFPSPLA